MGGGVVECDVRASAEGAIVVIHDAVVDRTTDGTGPSPRRLSRNCAVLTPATVLARTAVRPFRGEPGASRFPHSKPCTRPFRTRRSI
jgi:glycerophosphoryl diester phosphodiesterase